MAGIRGLGRRPYLVAQNHNMFLPLEEKFQIVVVVVYIVLELFTGLCSHVWCDPMVFS